MTTSRHAPTDPRACGTCGLLPPRTKAWMRRDAENEPLCAACWRRDGAAAPSAPRGSVIPPGPEHDGLRAIRAKYCAWR